MLRELKQMLQEFANDGELFDSMASCYKGFYDALMKAGFSEEQALQILVSQGMGIKSS